MDGNAVRDTLNKYIETFKKNLMEHSELTATQKQYIEEYPEIIITEKKKRLRNIIADEERCHANKACGERCTRKKKCGENVCGTHEKGTPHGIINETYHSTNTTKKVDVWTQDICGIVYYIDANKNVYNSHDIMINMQQPRVIGSYDMDLDGEYSISHY